MPSGIWRAVKNRPFKTCRHLTIEFSFMFVFHLWTPTGEKNRALWERERARGGVRKDNQASFFFQMISCKTHWLHWRTWMSRSLYTVSMTFSLFLELQKETQILTQTLRRLSHDRARYDRRHARFQLLITRKSQQRSNFLNLKPAAGNQLNHVIHRNKMIGVSCANAPLIWALWCTSCEGGMTLEASESLILCKPGFQSFSILIFFIIART